MEIAVVGPSEFTLGFQLAGVSEFHNPEGEEETVQTFRDLLTIRQLVSWWSTPRYLQACQSVCVSGPLPRLHLPFSVSVLKRIILCEKQFAKQ